MYDTDDYKNSYVIEFDIPDCEDLYPEWPFNPVLSKVSFLGMAYMLGMLFGAVFCGYFADLIGRIPVMMITVILTSVFSFAGSFVDDFWAWFFLRFFAGMTSKGLFMSALMVSIEIVGPEWRMILGIAIQVYYTSTYRYGQKSRSRSSPKFRDLVVVVLEIFLT